MTEPPNSTPEFSLWKDYISPVFCCCSRKKGYQEIGAETAGEMTQRLQDLHGMFDRLNEQLQSVQGSNEMQRVLQERLVEQVHELDDIITANKGQLLTEIQESADREASYREEHREALLRYLEEERLREIEEVLTGHSNNSAQVVEHILGIKSRVGNVEGDVLEITRGMAGASEEIQKLDLRISMCESGAGIGEEDKALLLGEVKQNSVLLKEQDDAVLRRIQNLESTNDIILGKFETGEDGQKQVDAAFITRLASNDQEQAQLKTKLSDVERRVNGLATRGYVDTLFKTLEEDRDTAISESVERTAALHIELTKKELSQQQAERIGEIEGKLEGLRLLVTGLVKSVETRDTELSQTNKCYFDELQRHVDDTSEELRRTFAEFKVIKRNFEEQHRRMSSLERSLDNNGDAAAIEDDIHVLATKLDRLESRVEHVVDKVVELGDRSPSPELDDLARLKRDLRKGSKPLKPTTARRQQASSSATTSNEDSTAAILQVQDVAPCPTESPTDSERRRNQLSGLGEKSTLQI